MGKRSEFEKKPRDAYFTIDPVAVERLAPYLPEKPFKRFVEPCAGGADLVKALMEQHMVCQAAYDIEPQSPHVIQRNCLTLTESDLYGVDMFITNPPFTWKVLQPIMDHLINLRPTWLLLPADYMHNVRMGPYMKKCGKVVSIGRMYWEENKKKGVDNYAWFLFNKDFEGKTEFIGR